MKSLPTLEDWFSYELSLIQQRKEKLLKYQRQLHTKSYEYWYETFGFTKEEIDEYKNVQ